MFHVVMDVWECLFDDQRVTRLGSPEKLNVLSKSNLSFVIVELVTVSFDLNVYTSRSPKVNECMISITSSEKWL